ncbi:N-acyl amino acid synthase FeeM domain-containing protein [Devosia sp.]|uniref:N-acyl amino acid synthase FeeM domain-containing protein n=1 Tax=Devosia sp. TaxID=1871048 RepID=UPI003A93F42B
MDVTDNPIYRLRYEAYRREESVPFNDTGIVVDDLDTAPNGMCFGVHIDGELVSSIRLHHISAQHPFGASMKTCADVLQPLLDQGETFIDPSRFTADYEASLAYPALPFLTLRIAVMASVYFNADACLALVRPEHTAFYRRVFGSEEMSPPRVYPGLAFPVQLFGAYVNTKLPMTLRRYPFFMSTEEERRELFGRAPDEHFERPQRAKSRLAYERAMLSQQLENASVAAE